MTYRELAGELPWRERAELDKLLAMARPGQRQKAEKAAENLAKARRKRRLNAVSDRERRVLVGARVPREEALAIELAARERGVSTYRFVRDALLAAAAPAPPSLAVGQRAAQRAPGPMAHGSFGGRGPGGLGESSTYRKVILPW